MRLVCDRWIMILATLKLQPRKNPNASTSCEGLANRKVEREGERERKRYLGIIAQFQFLNVSAPDFHGQEFSLSPGVLLLQPTEIRGELSSKQDRKEKEEMGSRGIEEE